MWIVYRSPSGPSRFGSQDPPLLSDCRFSLFFLEKQLFAQFEGSQTEAGLRPLPDCVLAVPKNCVTFGQNVFLVFFKNPIGRSRWAIFQRNETLQIALDSLIDARSVHYMQHSLAYANGKSLPTIRLFQRAKLQILECCVHAGVDLRGPRRKSRDGQEAAKRTLRGGPRAESGGGHEEVKRR